MKKAIFLILLFFQIAGVSSQEIWNHISTSKSFSEDDVSYRDNTPSTYKLFQINNKSLALRLLSVKPITNADGDKVMMRLPTPLGIQRFYIKEAAVLSNELATKFPNIKSYVGVGIDDPTAMVRFSNSAIGFHAMISSVNYPLFFIDPFTKDKNVSIAYPKSAKSNNKFNCLVEDTKESIRGRKTNAGRNLSDGKLRTYRLALIATGEYAQFHLNNQNVASDASDAVKKEAVLSAMATTVTRVNGIFERDLGVTMKLVANNENLIFLDAATDGLTDDDADKLIDESQIKCDAIIENANYDIGHAFSTGGGGLAGLAVVCKTGEKGQGITGSSSPVNDTFDIDFVAHEMGHQFGANHTQNNDCNRNGPTAVEPGSASTIMGYAGICDPNVQGKSDAYFHAVSIAEMWNIISSTGTCAVITDTNNTVPIANAGNDFTIPKSTPFVLKGAATDADVGNVLTYNWEQTDNQVATMPPQATNSLGPMFRSLPSITSVNRYMPALATVLGGNLTSTWEVIPSVSRVLNFSLTVRDNVLNGGATDRDDVRITIDGTAGPFLVTSQTVNTTLLGNSEQTITWDVSNTDNTTINCTQVNILLSTDGGLTFPNMLKANTPNDGAEQVILTNITTTDARIMIEAVNTVFYAVNTTKFSIDKTASVDDELFLNFSLYPNPSEGSIHVSFDLKSSDKVEMQLFDLNGRLIAGHIYENSSSKFATTLDYNDVASGMYFLKIRNGFFSTTKKLYIK